MKILHISTLTEGGAANAAIRLHESMLKHGIDSVFLSLKSSNKKITNHFHYDGFYKKIMEDYPLLTMKNLISEKFLKKYKNQKFLLDKKNNEKLNYTTPITSNNILSFTLFSYPESIYDITSTKQYQDAEIIHLHWVADFLDYKSFFSKVNKPIVWTFHDENPYLGGFHYQDDVVSNKNTHFQKEREFIELKKRLIQPYEKITIISPSDWIAYNAKQSEVFSDKRVKTIRYTLDPTVFKPRDKFFSRELFQLPFDKKIILITSHDLSVPRKGVKYVEELISNQAADDFIFVFAGNNLSIKKSNVISVGTVTDEVLLSCLYSAADYFLLPSLLDNLPNTLLESLFCGTPVIAFKIGDFEDLFQGNDFGVLVDLADVESLSRVLEKIRNEEIKFDKFKIVENALNIFSQKKVVNQYVDEYRLLLNR